MFQSFFLSAIPTSVKQLTMLKIISSSPKPIFQKDNAPKIKRYVNTVVNKLPEGEKKLIDAKVFWINILLVWIVFL
ncbi:MAG TPA: hypothetical protein VFC84_14400 [Desulfosporosinus sp.]|nr:hypothetical protein [Desulfosporosinus sp.]